MTVDLRAARFLVGVLADHFDRMGKDDDRLEKYWKAKLDALEEEIPDDPAERTPEQWEELVRLTGETYYAMAAHTNTRSVAEHTARLREALDDDGRGH